MNFEIIIQNNSCNMRNVIKWVQQTHRQLPRANFIVGCLLASLVKIADATLLLLPTLHNYIWMTFFYDAVWPSPSPCSVARLASWSWYYWWDESSRSAVNWADLLYRNSSRPCSCSPFGCSTSSCPPLRPTAWSRVSKPRPMRRHVGLFTAYILALASAKARAQRNY